MEANTSKAKAALERFNRGLDDKAIKVTATIDQTSFARAKAAGARLGGEETVDLKANVDQSSFARARTAMAALSKEGGGAGSVFSQANLSFGQWAIGLGAALPVLVDVTAAVGALTASAAAATAGVGALAVGGGGAGAVGLGGLVSIAAPAISSLKDLKTAQDAYTLAVQQYGKHSTQARTAFSKLRIEQKRAGPEAAKFAGELSHIGRQWKDLTKAGQRDFFGMLNDGIARLNQKLPLLAKSANKSVGALRVGFDEFLKKATGPEFDKFIQVMTRTFANSMKPIGEGFGNIAKVLERIAVAVAPDVVRVIKQLRDVTTGWLESTRNAGQLRETIHGFVNQTEAWVKLIAQAGKLIVAVLVPGMGQGKKAVEGVTATLKGWTDWVNAHPREMRDFFKEGLKTTKELAQVVLGFLPMLFQISTAMRPIARAFLWVAKSLNSIKLGNISALTVLLGTFVGAKLAIGAFKFAKGLREIAVAFGLIEAAAGGAAAAEAAAGAAGGGGMISTTASKSVLGGAGGAAAGKTFGTRFLAGFQTALAAGGGLALAAGTKKAVEEASHSKSALSGLGSVVKNLIGGPTGLGLKGLSELTGSQIPNNLAKLLNPLNHVKTTFNAVTHPIQSARDALHGIAHPIETASNAWGALTGAASSAAASVGDKIKGLVAKYGSLLLAGHHMSKSQRQDFIDLAITARDKGEITQKQLERVTGAFTNNTSKWRQSMRKVADATGESMKTVIDHVGNMKTKVSKTYDNMVKVTFAGTTMLVSHTNDALKALGARELKWQAHSAHAVAGVGGGHPAGRQKGGLAATVPGNAPGDRHTLALGGVPIARVESKEGIFVGNRNLMAVMDKANAQVPRKLAKGGMAAMVSEANRFEARHFPYAWGGGHGGFGIQPVDCSGAVSDILHAAGLLGAPMTSGSLMSWGKPGKGPLTVYANPHHTVMSLNGRVFGTSGSNPGGGAGWIDGAKGSALAPGAVRTMDVGAGMAALKRILIEGPKSPLKNIAQASVDKTWGAAKAYIAKKTPSGAFGGGQASIYKGNLDKVFPHPGVGEPPPFLAPWQAAMLAERAGLPGITYAQIAKGESNYSPGAISPDGGYGLWQMTPRVQLASTVAKWNRIGSYFNPWDNARMAKVLAGGGTGVSNYFGTGFVKDPNKHWHGEKNFAKGGIVAPYVGSFDKGGQVASTGLGLLHEGETVVPGMQRGGIAPTFPRGLIRALRQLIHFTPAHSRHDRRQEMHLLQRISRTEGSKQLRLIGKALDKFGVNFSKGERKRLRELARDQRHGGGLTPQEHRELHHLRQERRQARRQTDIREQIAVQTELLTEFKQWRQDMKADRRARHDVRANETAVFAALRNFMAREIGAQYAQQRRNAAPGAAVRY